MNSVEYNKDLLIQADPVQLLQHIVCSNSDIILKPGEKLLYSGKMKRKTVTNRVTGSKTTGNNVRIFEGQKFCEVVTDENNSVRITLIHRHIVSLINDGRINQL